MKLRVVATAFLLCLAGCGKPESDWSAVDRALKPLVDRGELAGVVTLVRKDGGVVHQSAIGLKDIASGAPLEIDTIFRAFSMTKPVTAVAMMILYDEGKWSPEDPVTKFLPELEGVQVFRGLDAEGKPILTAPASLPTMAQLMTHTAGFSYGFGPGYVDEQYRGAALGQAQSADEYVAALAKLPLSYEPGSRWEYSVSMDVQGAIVERLSGQDLATFMEERIFRPLGMVDTGFYIPESKRARLASFYRWKDGKLETMTGGAFASSYEIPPGFASGGAGLVTTSSDYGRFAQMLLNGGELDGARIIGEASARTIMTDHLPPELVGGGFGIGVQQIRPGYQYGYNGVVVTDPEAANVALGKGSYLWDGAAGTWFWADPENRIVFVGMIQRLGAPGMPNVQGLSQHAVKAVLDRN